MGYKPQNYGNDNGMISGNINIWDSIWDSIRYGESASALVRQETEDRIQNPGIVVCSCYEWGSPLKPQEGLTRPIAKATTWLSALSGVFTHCREAQGLVWADKGHHVHLSKRAEWLTCLCYCRIPIAGGFRMENPIEIDNLGVPPFQETSM